MPIYSRGGFIKGSGGGNEMFADNVYSTAQGAMSPFYAGIACNAISSGASSTTSINFLDVYSGGHWGGALMCEIEIATTYYGVGIDRFLLVGGRSGHATLTHLTSFGAENAGSSSCQIATTATYSGTWSGQNVYRTTLSYNTGDAYKQTRAMVRPYWGPSAQYTHLFDNASSQANVAAARDHAGPAYHFLTTGISGHPDRRTA